MSGIYHDEPIQGRGSGRRDRSSDRDRRSRALGYRSNSSSWTFISEEELYGRRGTRDDRVSAGSLPEKLRKLLEMTRTYETDDRKRTEAFLEQAAYMADYEEDYRMRGIPVRHIFVAYQEMQPDELRGYFAWRTRIRAGEKVTGGRDFTRLYTAELINLAGVSSAQEAFDRLLYLQASAGASDTLLADASLKHVLRDFVIAHNLGHDLALAYCIDDPEKETADLGLAYADTVDDHTLYAAVRTLAGDQINGSRFLPMVEEDACHVIARTVRIISGEKSAMVPRLSARTGGSRTRTSSNRRFVIFIFPMPHSVQRLILIYNPAVFGLERVSLADPAVPFVINIIRRIAGSQVFQRGKHGIEQLGTAGRLAVTMKNDIKLVTQRQETLHALDLFCDGKTLLQL